MRKLSAFVLLLLLFCGSAFSQQVPRGMKYQAVARDRTGDVLSNKKISLKISLLGNAAQGKVYYTEVHELTTNQFGLFDLVIGDGKVERGEFSTIPWSQEDIWMQISLKDNQRSDYMTISNSKLLAVPYAFPALTASELAPKSKGQSNYPGISSTSNIPMASAASNPPGVPSTPWITFGNSGTNSSTDKLGTTDAVDLVMITTNIERLRITKEGNINIANSLKVGQDVEVGRDLTVKNNVRLNTTGGNTINNGAFTVDKASPTSLTGTLTTNGATALKNTLTVDGATNLNNTLSVNNQSATLLTGTLTANGAAALNNTLTVDGAAALKSTLTTNGATNLNSTLNVNNNSATALSGTLAVNGATTLNNKLDANGQVTVTANLANAQDDYSNYPLRVQGNEQGLAIRLNASAPDRGNNFITFFNNSGEAEGRIEGFSGIAGGLRSAVIGIIGDPTSASQDKNQEVSGNMPGAAVDYFGTTYAFGAYSLTLGLVDNIIRLIVNATACAVGVGIAGDCDDVAWSVVDVVVAGLQLGGYIAYNETGNGGVAYESGGADYAEWLQKLDTTEVLSYGDVVGVKGGVISKTFKDAEKFMIISHKPVMIGGMPSPEKGYMFEKVAFMGQVPVKVIGQAHKGDYILPSGNNDGMAIAVAPSTMKTRDYQRIIGIAWSESDGKKIFNYINTAVGINTNDMAGVIAHMQVVMNNMQVAISKLKPDYKPLYFATDKSTVLNTKEFTVSPSLKEAVGSNLLNNKNTDLKETLKEAKKYAQAQGFNLKEYPYLSEFFDNPTEESMQKVYDHYTKVLAKAQNQLVQMQKNKYANAKN